MKRSAEKERAAAIVSTAIDLKSLTATDLRPNSQKIGYHVICLCIMHFYWPENIL